MCVHICEFRAWEGRCCLSNTRALVQCLTGVFNCVRIRERILGARRICLAIGRALMACWRGMFISYPMLERCFCLCAYMYIWIWGAVRKGCLANGTAVTGWRRLIGCLKLQVICAKEPLILGLSCGKWPMRIRHPMTLRHPVSNFKHVCLSRCVHIVREGNTLMGWLRVVGS